MAATISYFTLHVALASCSDIIVYLLPWQRTVLASSEPNYKSRMSSFLLATPQYGTALQANGHAEVWTDSFDKSKFEQYGWRCTTNEDGYSNKTLLGNWYQERFDIQKIQERKPLPSQYAHHFETLYSTEYNREEKREKPTLMKREPHAYPSHQPELVQAEFKPIPRSCYMIDYIKFEGVSRPCPPIAPKTKEDVMHELHK
ncbi:cilia- and flagella-associated protein 68 [Pleurodeles waltl]|uniref:cilia- and flagella-associated protein 68 n=1 Tax=Pleurodeles waltl TaxID=8319 RepID=UPI0037099410